MIIYGTNARLSPATMPKSYAGVNVGLTRGVLAEIPKVIPRLSPSADDLALRESPPRANNGGGRLQWNRERRGDKSLGVERRYRHELPVSSLAEEQHVGEALRIESLDANVIRMFELVREALEAATSVFLDSNREQARGVIERDRLIDAIHDQTERAVLQELTRAGTVDPVRQTRLLLMLRILPELERSGDLAEHIASHAAQGLAPWLTPRARSIVRQMGVLGSEMWRLATDAYATGDATVADLLRERDDEVDDLHVGLTSELAGAHVSIPVAIEMALVARYFERLGDHAVNVTRRLQGNTEVARP